MDLLISERVDEVRGCRRPALHPSGRERWVINRLRALCAWYTKGHENGSLLRVAVNHAQSLADLRKVIEDCYTTASGPS